MKTRKFDSDLYPLQIIKQGVVDYSHIAKILVIPGKNQTTCHFVWCKVDEQRTIDEFSNYLLDLIGSRGNKNDSN